MRQMILISALVGMFFIFSGCDERVVYVQRCPYLKPIDTHITDDAPLDINYTVVPDDQSH